MACRLEALPAVATGQVFDEDFFLYKEDIELSLRLRKNGWKLLYEPKVRAFHCRGWGGRRREVPLALRLAAARSEVLLYRKHPSPYMLWAVGKYLLVRLCHC
jgi:GT2 family glycosyltransferase